MQKKIHSTLITLRQGDITQETADAIVNAANSSLLGGGGVDGAIHRAGGPKILEECRAIRARQGSLPTGQAVITSGGKLPAKQVIHTVGPVFRGGGAGEPELLRNAYYNSLALGSEHSLETIAFPSISTGVYGYPKNEAAAIALQTVEDFVSTQNHTYLEIRFIVFSSEDYSIYANLLNKKN